MRRRHAALVIAALIVPAACGTSATSLVSEHLADTKTLVADSLGQLQEASTYHLVITWSEGQADYKADLRIKVPGDAVGTVTEDGSTVSVVQTGGKQYVQGKDFISEYGGSTEGSMLGNRWVVVTPNLLRTPVLDVAKLTSLPSYFLNIEISGKRVDHVPAATESTAEIETTWGNVYISELAPHRLVKLETKNDFVAQGGLANVEFELFAYGETVDIQAPTAFADITNPTTLPPQYQQSGQWRWGACIYAYECGFTGTVQNAGGMYAAAASTYTWNLYTYPGHGFLGRCGGPIRVVAHKKTVSIGCFVTSAAFRAYTGSEVTGDLVINNPAYSS
jgi:hypothetical protein